MMKKHSVCAVLVLSLVVSATASAIGKRESPSASGANNASTRLEGGELRIGIATEPATLDPLSPSNTADGRSILFNVFEGLVKPTPDGSFQPAVAESYTVEQGALVYTFKLRPDLKFHDGTTVSTQDVLFTLNTAVSAQFNGFNEIDKIEENGDKIIITLKAPNVEFLPYLTLGVAPQNNADREAHPIGTGPYSIASYTTQQSLVLVKNPNYWQADLPHLDKVTYIFAANSDDALRSLQGGNTDAANITGGLLDQLNPALFDIIETPSNAVQLLALNNASKPLDDVRVRQALNYAVNTQEIIDLAFYGRGQVSGNPMIPGLSRYYEASLKNPYPVDIDKAKSLLAAAGYQNGFSLEITVPSNYMMHVDTAQVLVNQFAKAGVKAAIRQVDWATWLSDVYRDRRYEATIISLDSATVSPRGFLDRYLSTAGSNFVNFASVVFDQTYGAALAELDEPRRIALYKQAERVLSDEAASVYIQDIVGFWAFRKGFAGVINYPAYVFDVSTIYRTR
jgi:peptide/nickel transport system substrate-binding protein